MSPEELRRLDSLEKKLNDLLYLYNKENLPSRKEYTKPLILKDVQNNTEFDNTAGVKIGYSTSKVSFFGTTPVVRQAAVTSPSGGGGSSSDAIDNSSRTAIGQIKTALTNLGLTL